MKTDYIWIRFGGGKIREGWNPRRIPTLPFGLCNYCRGAQAVKYSTPAANSGWSFSPGTFLNVPLL